MPASVINGVRINFDWHGDGPPVALVHGSWGDHHNWDRVVPVLARTFRVLTYDRRGHSQSERLPGQGRIDEDVADLAQLIESAAPVHIVGSSFGGSIVLHLAAARPELFASLTVHEPPLVGLLGDDPALPAVQERIAGVIATLQAGRTEAGARQFVETVALGPGMWEKLPAELQQTFVFNAPTWLDEMNDSTAFVLDLERLAAFDRPALLTRGGQSPPFFGRILDRIGAALPRARRDTFTGAGHVPQLTHPDDYARVVGGFLQNPG